MYLTLSTKVVLVNQLPEGWMLCVLLLVQLLWGADINAESLLGLNRCSPNTGSGPAMQGSACRGASLQSSVPCCGLFACCLHARPTAKGVLNRPLSAQDSPLRFPHY